MLVGGFNPLKDMKVIADYRTRDGNLNMFETSSHRPDCVNVCVCVSKVGTLSNNPS